MHRLIYWFYGQLYTNLAWAYDFAVWIGAGGLWYRCGAVAETFIGDQPILEVGCGTGHLLKRLAANGCDVTGLDRSPQMVRIAKRRLHKAGLSARVIQGEANTLPFPDASIGTLITCFPTCHGDPAVQNEFARVLRPDGRWILVDVMRARRFTLRFAVLAVLSWLARFGRPTSKIPTGSIAIHGRNFPEIKGEQVPVGPTTIQVWILRDK